jgi:hypothetical protein
MPNDINTTLQNYLKIFVSWPFAVIIIGLCFFLLFKDEIKAFLATVKSIKAGKVEVTSESQIQTDNVAEKLPAKKKRPSPKEKKLASQLEEMNGKLGEVNKTVQDKDGLIDFLIEKNTSYENAYLNLLLVPKTKAALRLLASGMSKPDIMDELRKNGNSEDEVQAVFQVLGTNGLIQEEAGQTSVTAKGQRFLAKMT